MASATDVHYWVLPDKEEPQLLAAFGGQTCRRRSAQDARNGLTTWASLTFLTTLAVFRSPNVRRP